MWTTSRSSERKLGKAIRRASAPTRQLLPQGRQGLLLGPLHRHAADLQPRGRLPEREALEDGEPQGRGLGCRQLIDQLLQRQAIYGLADGWLGLRRCQLIEQAGLAIGCGIKADVAERAAALLVLTAEMRTSRTRSRRWCCSAPLMQRRR